MAETYDGPPSLEITTSLDESLKLGEHVVPDVLRDVFQDINDRQTERCHAFVEAYTDGRVELAVRAVISRPGDSHAIDWCARVRARRVISDDLVVRLTPADVHSDRSSEVEPEGFP